jgi:hypothetical protein
MEAHRLLLLAIEALDERALRETVVTHTRETDAEVIVVAPAVNTRLRYWMSDEAEARRAAAARVRYCLDRLDCFGVPARGLIGDPNPMQAIADAIVLFDPDELIVATPGERHANWLTREVAQRARRCFGLPVRRLVVEPRDAERSDKVSWPPRRPRAAAPAV